MYEIHIVIFGTTRDIVSCHASLYPDTERKQHVKYNTIFTFPLTLLARMPKCIATMFHVFSNAVQIFMSECNCWEIAF